jgi:hypothetical protein
VRKWQSLTGPGRPGDPIVVVRFPFFHTMVPTAGRDICRDFLEFPAAALAICL